MRKYLELTPIQKKELDEILDEIRTLEMQNIKALEKNMANVQQELKINQQNLKIQHAYDFDENSKGSIINITE
jgi:DNA-binding PadR family transcriptional regulator